MKINVTKLLTIENRVSKEEVQGTTNYVGLLSSDNTGENQPYSFELEEQSNEGRRD